MKAKNIKRRISNYFKKLQEKATSLKERLKRKKSQEKELSKENPEKEKEVISYEKQLPEDINTQNIKQNHDFQHDSKFNDYNFWKCEMAIDVNEVIEDESDDSHIAQQQEDLTEQDKLKRMDLHLSDKNRKLGALVF